MIKTLKRYLTIYFSFFKLNIKTLIEYKADTIIGFLTQIPLQIVQFLFIWVIFTNIDSLVGWSFYEIALIYGIMLCSKGISDTFFDNLYEMPKVYIRHGTFDNILTQPINSMFNIIARAFYPGALSNFVIGILIIITSVSNLTITFGIIQVIQLIFFVLCGGLIFGGLLTIASVSTFWVVESIDIIWNTYAIHEFAFYPITAYGKLIQGLLVFVLPYAFASYYPATFFLGKSDGNIVWFSPVMVILVWIVAVNVWKLGLKKYGSTGS